MEKDISNKQDGMVGDLIYMTQKHSIKVYYALTTTTSTTTTTTQENSNIWIPNQQ